MWLPGCWLRLLSTTIGSTWLQIGWECRAILQNFQILEGQELRLYFDHKFQKVLWPLHSQLLTSNHTHQRWLSKRHTWWPVKCLFCISCSAMHLFWCQIQPHRFLHSCYRRDTPGGSHILHAKTKCPWFTRCLLSTRFHPMRLLHLCRSFGTFALVWARSFAFSSKYFIKWSLFSTYQPARASAWQSGRTVRLSQSICGLLQRRQTKELFLHKVIRKPSSRADLPGLSLQLSASWIDILSWVAQSLFWFWSRR